MEKYTFTVEGRETLVKMASDEFSKLVDAKRTRGEKLAQIEATKESLRFRFRKEFSRVDAASLMKEVDSLAVQWRTYVKQTMPSTWTMFWRRLRASTPRCKEQFVVWIALTLLIASWLYPPWEHYNPHTRGVKADIGGVFKPWAPSPPHRQGVSAQHPHGWYFIFDTKQTETNTDELVMRVDFGRLMLLDGVIVAVAGGVLFTIRQSKSAQP